MSQTRKLYDKFLLSVAEQLKKCGIDENCYFHVGSGTTFLMWQYDHIIHSMCLMPYASKMDPQPVRIYINCYNTRVSPGLQAFYNLAADTFVLMPAQNVLRSEITVLAPIPFDVGNDTIWALTASWVAELIAWRLQKTTVAVLQPPIPLRTGDGKPVHAGNYHYLWAKDAWMAQEQAARFRAAKKLRSKN